ncbi:hypothetical protein QUA41_14985 [Microcoleus sp. Pol11C1]
MGNFSLFAIARLTCAGLIPGFLAHTSRSNLLFILETGLMSISPKSVF